MVAHNRANEWTKKASSKLNMGSSNHLMGVHVTAYVDGTVHVITGGLEFGQSLNAKVALVGAQTLGQVRAESGGTRMS